MNKPSIAILVSSLLLAGSALAQVNPTTPTDRSGHGAHSYATKKARAASRATAARRRG